jgi:hypothetical protein
MLKFDCCLFGFLFKTSLIFIINLPLNSMICLLDEHFRSDYTQRLHHSRFGNVKQNPFFSKLY